MDSELFFKVWRNVYIKSKIFSLIQNSQCNFSYNGTPKLFLLVCCRKYEIILDKLKNGQYISICSMGLKLFLVDYLDNPVFEESFQLLWNNYREIIIKLNPLSLLLFETNSTNIFKYIFKNCYLKDNSIRDSSNCNNNYKNHISINPALILFDLLGDILSNDNFHNQNEIPKFIIQELKENKNNIILLNGLENENSTLKKMKLNDISNSRDRNLSIKEIIYSKRNLKFGDIPILLNDDFLGIEDGYKEKLSILNELGLDTTKFCNQFMANGNDEEIVIEYEDLQKDTLQLFWELVVNNGFGIKIDPNELFFNHLEFLKFFLLSRVGPNKQTQFKQLLSNNKDNITDIKSLIKLVEDHISSFGCGVGKDNKTVSIKDELYYYFDVYLIYHYLKENDLEMVEYYLGTIIKLKNFGNKRSYGRLREDSIALLFYYSILTCSVQVFNLFKKYDHLIDFENVIQKQFNFLNLSVDVSKKKAKIFFEVLEENQLSPNQIQEINRIIITNYNGELLEFIITQVPDFSSVYYQTLADDYDIVFLHIILKPYSKNNENSDGSVQTIIDRKKVDIFVNSISTLNEKETIGGEESNPDLFSIKLSNKYIGELLDIIIRNGSGRSYLKFHLFTTRMLLSINKLNIDEAINIFKKLDQSSLKKYFHKDINDSKDCSSRQQFINLSNKSNILNYHFFRSIYENNNSNLIKILKALNDDDYNNNNNKIQDIINNYIGIFNNSNQDIKNNNSNNLEKIQVLFKSGLLNNFDIKGFLEYLINSMKASKEYIFDLLRCNHSRSQEELLNYFSEYFGETITIHYDINHGQTQSEQLKTASTLVKAFTSNHFKQIYDFFESKQKSLKQAINDIHLFRLIDNSMVCFSVEWFKKLYKSFLKVHLDSETTLMVAINCNFEVFEFIWTVHLETDKNRIDFIKDLLELMSQDNHRWNISGLFEYILKEKEQFLHDSCNDNSTVSQIFTTLLFYGNLKLFKLVRSVFPDFNFEMNLETTIEFLTSNISISPYFSNIILYLYNNNLLNLSILEDSINQVTFDDSSISELTRPQEVTESSTLSKSNLILIHSILNNINK